MATVHSDDLWRALKAAGVLPQDGNGLRRIEIVAEVGQPLRMVVETFGGEALTRTVTEFLDGKTAVNREERPT